MFCVPARFVYRGAAIATVFCLGYKPTKAVLK